MLDTILNKEIADCGSTEYINILIENQKTLERMYNKWYLADDNKLKLFV